MSLYSPIADKARNIVIPSEALCLRPNPAGQKNLSGIVADVALLKYIWRTLH